MAIIRNDNKVVDSPVTISQPSLNQSVGSQFDEFAPRRATRKAAKLRLALDGIAGSGKTMSALLIASGIGGKIVLIDTENGSGDLYSDIIPYDVVPMKAPYSPERYIKIIKRMEELGYDVIIIDSLSHAWAGSGGALEKQQNVTKRTGNSYTAWAEITPLQNQLIDTIIQSSAHVIVTMRTKMEHAIETDISGKTTIRKLGMGVIQREGMEYEMTVVFDMNGDHSATVTKDRTRLFDGQTFIPTKKTGETLKAWLDGN